MRTSTALVMVALLVGACSDVRTYESRGRVIAVQHSENRIVVDHEDIPGLMPAMTMRLRVAVTEDLDDLVAGDAIGFRLNVSDDSTWVDQIVVLPPDAVDGRPSQPVINPNADVVAVMPGDTTPDFEVIDHDELTVSPARLRGRPYVITFIYTRCPLPDYCPLITQRFLQIQARLEESELRTRLLAATVDPEFDTPHVLAEYGSRVGAHTERWRFVTGSPEQISRLATIFGVFYSAEADEVNHNLSTVLVDSEGRVRAIWRGNEWSVGEVVETIEHLERVEKNRAVGGD